MRSARVSFRSLRSFLLLVGILIVGVPLVSVAVAIESASAAQVAGDARRLDHVADEVDEAVAEGDWVTARLEWREFGELWLDVEDGFRAASRDGYRSIEAAMVRISDLLRTESPDADRLRAEIAELRTLITPFADDQ